MKDLRIQFLVQPKERKITFYIERGKLEDWVKRAMEKFPNVDIPTKGSELLTYTMAKATKEVCEKAKIKDWETLKPNFILFKTQSEIPREARIRDF